MKPDSEAPRSSSTGSGAARGVKVTDGGEVNTGDNLSLGDGTATAGESSSETDTEYPESVFISDPSEISKGPRLKLRTAYRKIRETNTAEDSLSEAIPTLRLTRDDLERIVDRPGVDSATVSEAIDHVETDLHHLMKISTVLSDLKRKQVLIKNGMGMSSAKLEQLRDSVDKAVEAAQELGRSHPELEDRWNDLVETSGVDLPKTGHSQNASTIETKSDTEPAESPRGQTEADSNGQDSTDGEASSPNRDELIADIRLVRKWADGTLSDTDMRKYGRYSRDKYLDVFDSWDDVLAAAFPDTHETTTALRENSRSPGSGETVDDREAMRSAFLGELSRVSDKLSKRPTMGEFDKHSQIDSSSVYDLYDGWSDAIDAAPITAGSREDLLEELHRLNGELGVPPLSSLIDEHGQYSAYDYRMEFGSVEEALEEAGLDAKAHVVDTVVETLSKADDRPRMADFESWTPYSSGVIYRYFDGWSDAIEAAKSVQAERESRKTSSDSSGDGLTVEQNELSEQYDLLRNLRTLVSAIPNVPDDDERDDDPFSKWAAAVEATFQNGLEAAPSYGEQQTDQNPFSMKDYRAEYGDGNRVTTFGHVSASPLPSSLKALLGPRVDAGLDTFYLPIDQETNAPFPVIVESEDELRRAMAMLNRLPAEPASASQKPSLEDEGDEGDATDEQAGDERRDRSDSDLLDVNGVTDSSAKLLRAAGYHTRDNLKRAEMDDLAAINGIGSQLAMRIKLDVGG